ncbi:hypothetical protein ACLKA7_004396 [Drosophila subpalustris]
MTREEDDDAGKASRGQQDNKDEQLTPGAVRVAQQPSILSIHHGVKSSCFNVLNETRDARNHPSIVERQLHKIGQVAEGRCQDDEYKAKRMNVNATRGRTCPESMSKDMLQGARRWITLLPLTEHPQGVELGVGKTAGLGLGLGQYSVIVIVLVLVVVLVLMAYPQTHFQFHQQFHMAKIQQKNQLKTYVCPAGHKLHLQARRPEEAIAMKMAIT